MARPHVTPLGVTDNTVSYFYNGRLKPNIEQIIEIAKFFNVSTDYLLGLSDVPTTDKDLQYICDYTGLDKSRIEACHCRKEIETGGAINHIYHDGSSSISDFRRCSFLSAVQNVKK